MAEINAGRISEVLNDKADRDLNNVTPPYLQSRSVVDGVTVELWSDGYCVQRGNSNIRTNPLTIVLPQSYRDTSYTVIGTDTTSAQGGSDMHAIGVCKYTNKTFGLFGKAGSVTATDASWETSGYIN